LAASLYSLRDLKRRKDRNPKRKLSLKLSGTLKKLAAILGVLALQLAVVSCGSTVPYGTIATSTSGNWEAKLIGGTGQAAQLNFVVAFTLTNNFGTLEPIDVTGLGFFNSSECFPPNGVNGASSVNVNGNAELTASSSDQVTGTLSLTVNSIPPGNTLVLTASPPNGGLSGTSSGTTSTVGTLSNGVAWGTWQLTGGQSDASCTGSGTFLMCQSGVTCTIP
jgi:hypothetical protein